jgi:DNA-binding transcriptional LysR family regulator
MGVTMAALPTGMLNDASILSLRCFVAVVETQSFSSAARQLRLAASSVTKHIQLLEKAVNVALVHRTTRRISVSDAGERFYDQCLGILAQVDSAAAVMVAEKELSGHLRVTAPPSFATAALGPGIHEFVREHPGISVDVMVSSATPDLIRNRIDVAITIDDEPQSKLTHLRLAHCPLALCASPDYVARRGAPNAPRDLLHHECMSGRFSDLAEGWTLARNGVSQAVNARFKLLSDNGDVLRQACLGGAGIGNFYYFHVCDELRDGRLIRILPDYEPKPKNIFAIIPHRQIVRPQAKAFIEFVRGLLARDQHKWKPVVADRQRDSLGNHSLDFATGA